MALKLDFGKLPWHAQLGVFAFISLAGAGAFWYFYASPAEAMLVALESAVRATGCSRLFVLAGESMLLRKALEDAGTTDSAALRAALDKFDLMLFYGRIKFSTDAKTHGKQIGHDMVYMQWQKDASGKLVPQIVWPLSAKSADAVLRK